MENNGTSTILLTMENNQTTILASYYQKAANVIFTAIHIVANRGHQTSFKLPSDHVHRDEGIAK